MDAGLMKNMNDLLMPYENMVSIGRKLKKLLEHETQRKYDHMLRNSSKKLRKTCKLQSLQILKTYCRSIYDL